MTLDRFIEKLSRTKRSWWKLYSPSKSIRAFPSKDSPRWNGEWYCPITAVYKAETGVNDEYIPVHVRRTGFEAVVGRHPSDHESRRPMAGLQRIASNTVDESVWGG